MPQRGSANLHPTDLKFSDYEDIIVVDKEGVVVFYDVANLDFFDLHPDEIIGRKITSLYPNLTDDSSTLMRAVLRGETAFNLKQELTTKLGRRVAQVGSTFPIMADGEIFGAVEFARSLYDRGSLPYSKSHSEHKIFRKNNTLYTIDDIVTADAKMLAIKDTIRRVARTDSSVLVVGKTGTGKELVAQALHNLSGRCGNPFLSQNCAAIPATLFESTLFGTVKGSYTGAVDSRGLFEQAQGGTIFLDEINSMDITTQVKILKAIEEKRIRRVGGETTIDLDVRVVAAVNEDPYEMIAAGKLREDLFYRLSVVQVDLPVLLDRKDDIRCLVDHYVKYYSRRMNLRVRGVSPEVMDFFESYAWPGNVRELRYCIEAIFNGDLGDQIRLKDVPEYLRKRRDRMASPGEFGGMDGRLKDIITEYEKRIIEQELEKADGCAARAARELGLSKQAMKYKTTKYKLR